VEGEDCLSLLLRFDGGARGSLTTSQVSAGHKNCIALSIDGARSGLEWNQEQPNTLTIRRVASWEVLPKDPTLLGAAAAALARFPGGHPEGYPDAFRNLIAAIYAAIARVREGVAPGGDYPGIAAGCRGVALIEAVLRSARERRWVAIA
jgi:predicted dehydrogenase